MEIIRLENVTVEYPDNTIALANIRLSVKNGEFVALMGANGSGKTTLLRTIIGLTEPNKGKVFIFNKETDRKNISNIWEKVGFIFQDPDDQLFAPTVFEDVSYGPKNLGLSQRQIDRRCEDALDVVEMTGFKDKKTNALSYGQKRRVALAGVLAMKPEVILLDEPTSGLDPTGTTKIMKLLKKLNAEHKITMIMATHDCDMIPLFANRMILLDKGIVVADGLLKDVFSDFRLIRKSNLRLPRISHLIEVLSKDFKEFGGTIPFTIGQARQKIFDIYGSKN